MQGTDPELLASSTNLANAVNRLAVDHAGSWVLVRLADGHVLPTLYDSRPDSVEHSNNHLFPLIIRPTGITMKAARNQLKFHRAMRDAGYDLNDKLREIRPGLELLSVRTGSPLTMEDLL